MSVVAEQGGELYALLVDQVSEVMSLPASAFERNPPTLPAGSGPRFIDRASTGCRIGCWWCWMSAGCWRWRGRRGYSGDGAVLPGGR